MDPGRMAHRGGRPVHPAGRRPLVVGRLGVRVARGPRQGHGPAGRRVAPLGAGRARRQRAQQHPPPTAPGSQDAPDPARRRPDRRRDPSDQALPRGGSRGPVGADRPAGGDLLAMTVQQRLVTTEQLLDSWDAVLASPRREVIGQVIRDVCDGAQALAELDFAALCRAGGLPEPTRQAVRVGPRGVVYLDVWFEEYGVHVEIHGAQHGWGLAVVKDSCAPIGSPSRRASPCRSPSSGCGCGPRPSWIRSRRRWSRAGGNVASTAEREPEALRQRQRLHNQTRPATIDCRTRHGEGGRGLWSYVSTCSHHVQPTPGGWRDREVGDHDHLKSRA